MNWLIFIIIFMAGFANAVQDTIAHHFDVSIFIRIKSEKWHKWFESDWRNKPSHPIWFLWDGWHFFKSLEKLCYILIIWLLLTWWVALISAIMLGIGFDLFYHHILIRRD